MRLLLAALAALVFASSASAYYSPVLTAPASAFAERQVYVSCERTLPWAYGYADPESGEIAIARYFCNPLRSLASGTLTRPLRTAIGLITLTHEAIHTTGIIDEIETECYALQRVDEMAELFGASPGEGLALQALALPDSRALLRIYGDHQCHSGGALDLTPGDGIWP